MSLFMLPSLYSDGMIFQRERPLYIEGEACKPCVLTASLGGHTVTKAVEPGRFALRLPPLPASRGLTLTISAETQTVTLQNIYVGEVWLAGGQSNMAWALADTEEIKYTPVQANDDLRFYTVGRNYAAEPIGYDEGYAWAYCSDYGWVGCNAESALYFSAVAYHFAQKLYQSLGVPIGIINCNVGGSSIFSWLPKEAFLSNPDIQYKWEEQSAVMQEIDLQASHAHYYAFLDENKIQFDISKNISGTSRELPLIYYDRPGPYSFQRPEGLYYSMLEKVIRFPARGMIWYQGETETNVQGSQVYASALKSLVAHLQKYQEAEYGFHIVQLAPWQDAGAIYWADICNQQRRFMVDNPQYGMVTIGDAGGGVDIHPPRKQPVGERLAYAALDRNYRMPHEFTGPVAISARRLEGEIGISFIHAAGLWQQGSLGRFELISADGSVSEVSASLRLGAVYVACPAASSPAFVRYEYVSEPNIGLYNAAGFPASVFILPIE